MSRLIKDNDIILDGTLSRNEKTKQAFIKLGQLEDLLDDYGFEDIAELKNRLEEGVGNYITLCILKRYIENRHLEEDIAKYLIESIFKKGEKDE